MKNLNGPIIGVHFIRHNSGVIDTTHGLIHFPHLTMQVKSALTQTNAKPQAVLFHDSITIPQQMTKPITAFLDHVSEWNTTGTVTPVEKFTQTASLIISHSMSTITDRKIAVRVTNTTESPYTINKNTQTAEFSVVTPEKSKFINPVDMAILSMIPEGDPDLITYLTELLRTNKHDQQTNNFWFPTPEKPGNTEEHTPIQTRISKELCELQLKEKLNPKDDIESRVEFLKRFDWTDTLLTENEKQAVEDILVEYPDIFARHRMDIGMNTEFKMKLTPKDNKAVYSQSLPMPIHLKEDLINIPFCTNMGSSQCHHSQNMQAPYLHKGSPTENYVSLWISQKSTPWLQTIILTIITQSALRQTQHNTWQGNPYSASLTALRLITACTWRTNVQWKCLHSILLADFLPTNDLHKASADLWLFFRASCASNWTQLSKLTNVLNTWMILESQPIMLRSSPGTSGQSSSAFAMQDWI